MEGQRDVVEKTSERERDPERLTETERDRERREGGKRRVRYTSESKRRRIPIEREQVSKEGGQQGAGALPRALTADLSRGVLGDHGVGGELGVQDAAVCVGVHGQ